MSIENVHCSKCRKKLGSDKNNIADKFIYFKNGDLKYIELFHKKCAENSATYYWLAKDHIDTLGGIDGKK
jgi:hypothetical protein